MAEASGEEKNKDDEKPSTDKDCEGPRVKTPPQIA